MALWKPDPKLDLVLERVVDVPRELVWAAWTKPEHIVKWFTPAPWTTTHHPGHALRVTLDRQQREHGCDCDTAHSGCLPSL